MSFWKKKEENTVQPEEKKDEMKEFAKKRLEELSQAYEWITIDAYLVVNADMTSTDDLWKFELNQPTRTDEMKDFRRERLLCYSTLDEALKSERPQFGRRYFKVKALVPSRIVQKEGRTIHRVLTIGELTFEMDQIRYYERLARWGSEDYQAVIPFPKRTVGCATILATKEITPIEEIPYEEYREYIDEDLFENEEAYRSVTSSVALTKYTEERWCEAAKGVFSKGFCHYAYAEAIAEAGVVDGSYGEIIDIYKRFMRLLDAVKDEAISQSVRISLFLKLLSKK